MKIKDIIYNIFYPIKEGKKAAEQYLRQEEKPKTLEEVAQYIFDNIHKNPEFQERVREHYKKLCTMSVERMFRPLTI
jgi:hypothetical protein